jgi:23S rRNA (uracil1939-C5)-methyltransferase
LQTGDIIEAVVDRIAFGGEGVCRVKELVVFVPFTMSGDTVEIEIVERKKRYARGRLVRIIAPSQERTAPVCPYYVRCGGCQYQHIRYDAQLEIKTSHVVDAFTRIGKFAKPPVAGIVRSPRPYGYRGKAEFQVVRDDSGKWTSGFMYGLSHRVVDIESCAIMDDSINNDYQRFRKNLLAGGTGGLHEGKHIFWSRPESQASVVCPPGSVLRTVKGKHLLTPQQGFFQANTGLTERLVDEVVSMCALTGKETVLDAYCGSGLFTLFLAPHAGRVFGIETDAEAVNCAGINLQAARYNHAVFVQGDVAYVMGKQMKTDMPHIDVMICDPPRVGLSPRTLTATIDAQPARIVYVSCNPATQARDMKILADEGYDLKILQPVDMFPQTAHIEVVGLMERAQ